MMADETPRLRMDPAVYQERMACARKIIALKAELRDLYGQDKPYACLDELFADLENELPLAQARAARIEEIRAQIDALRASPKVQVHR